MIIQTENFDDFSSPTSTPVADAPLKPVSKPVAKINGTNGHHPPAEPEPVTLAAPSILGRTMPHSEQAEAALLGCFILDSDSVARAQAEGFEPDWLYTPAHRVVAESILAVNGCGERAEIVSICEDLRDRGALDQAGGVVGVNAIANCIPTTAFWHQHFETVREKWLLRDTARRLAGMLEQCYSGAYTFDLENPLHELAKSYERGKNGKHFPGRPLSSFHIPTDDDDSVLLGVNRWLCRGDSLIITGNSGVGKSSLCLQVAIHFALGRTLWSLPCPRPLRTLIIQAEDADGDIAECRASCERMMGLTDEEKILVDARISVIKEKIYRGAAFLRELRAWVKHWKPDLVMINPLQAFASCDMKDEQQMGAFLREGLNAINADDQFAYVIFHHTTKPPTGKEAVERKWNEVMYDMAGSHVLIDWTRATISMQAMDEEGHVQLVFSKRGGRAGLMTEAGVNRLVPTKKVPIRHSVDTFKVEGRAHPLHAIYWEYAGGGAPEANPPKIPRDPRGGKQRSGPDLGWNKDHLLTYFPDKANAAPISHIGKIVKDSYGMPPSSFQRYKNQLHDAGYITTTGGLWYRVL